MREYERLNYTKLAKPVGSIWIFANSIKLLISLHHAAEILSSPLALATGSRRMPMEKEWFPEILCLEPSQDVAGA
jgi:hypothetical protein